MSAKDFELRLQRLESEYKALLARENAPLPETNGIAQRYQNPVLTAGHSPIFWRYDLNFETNPYLLERMGINATFNCGAMEFEGKFVLAV